MPYPPFGWLGGGGIIICVCPAALIGGLGGGPGNCMPCGAVACGSGGGGGMYWPCPPRCCSETCRWPGICHAPCAPVCVPPGVTGVPRLYCSCCCAACIVASAKVCARGLGEVTGCAEPGVLARGGYGLFVTLPVCGLSSELASRYEVPGISFSTTPVGTLRLCPRNAAGGGGVARGDEKSSGVPVLLLADCSRAFVAIISLHHSFSAPPTNRMGSQWC